MNESATRILKTYSLSKEILREIIFLLKRTFENKDQFLPFKSLQLPFG